MKPQLQKYYPHDPENDVWGDCYRTALAILLDMDRDEIPHFGYQCPDGNEFSDRIDDWLITQGLTKIEVGYVAHSGVFDLDDVLEHVMMMNGEDLVYLLSGRSPRGMFNHVVVAGNGRVLFDPHPSGEGIAGPCMDSNAFYLTFIVKRDFVRQPVIDPQMMLPRS
jgi:hypothetical protein